MTVVEVDIGIAAQLGDDASLAFINAETSFQNGRIFLVLFVNENTIVATQAQTNLFRGNTKLVVRIDLCSVKTLLEIFDKLVVQAFKVVTLEDAICHIPIPITMVNMVTIALVIVAHLVPFDVDILAACIKEIWRQSGVVIDG